MSENSVIQKLKDAVKEYPGFPKPDIIFRDFLPVFHDPKLFDGMIHTFCEFLQQKVPDVDCIAGIESRGFLIGPVLALKLQVPFVPIRKPGKLPGAVKKETYSLEYGTDALEMQCDVVKEKSKFIIIDDLLATGGTMEASVKLIRSLGGIVEYCLVVMELSELKGKDKLSAPIYSLLQY